MRFKFHLGNQAYNIHVGSQHHALFGNALYSFVSHQITADPNGAWKFNPETFTAAAVGDDGWSEVEVINGSASSLDAFAATATAEVNGEYYDTWGFMFGDPEIFGEEFVNPDTLFKRSQSSNFISALDYTCWGLPGFWCQIYSDADPSHHFEFAGAMFTEDLMTHDTSTFSWLQNTMGSGNGSGLMPIETFPAILVFNYINSGGGINGMTEPTDQVASLYFGWYPAATQEEFSVLAYLGYDTGTVNGHYAVYNCREDTFFYDLPSVRLNVAYDTQMT